MSASSINKLPEGVLIAWYGDDFTGSAAVMEVLTFAGLPSVLFLDIPTPEQLAEFTDMSGIGIAGTARSHSVSWMENHLPTIFKFLRGLNAPVQHYKVCSTLDSSPKIGSIGKAIDLGQDIFSASWVPFFIAAPAIRRFQAFGNLFAAAPDGVFRLDRHPVMARHPVTPMDEADVVAHVARQTDKQFGLVNLEQMQSDAAAEVALVEQCDGGGEVIALDCVDTKTLACAGQLIWEHRDEDTGSIFTVGSQGVEYALIAHWQKSGVLPLVATPAGGGKAEQIIVVSGSVSEVTAAQISWAIDNGFVGIFFDAVSVLASKAVLDEAIEQAVFAAIDVVEGGKDPIIFTSSGQGVSNFINFHQAISQPNVDTEKANNAVGKALGTILERVLDKTDISRAVICGGDTSGHATQQLSIYALTAIAPTIPGAALFCAHSNNPRYQNLQLALKGGQMGTPDYFGWIKKGGGAQNQKRNIS